MKTKEKTEARSEVQRKAENNIIGEAYEELKSLVIKYAESDYPVLLVGETGTGKELFANLYMSHSTRPGKKPTVNCAEFTTELLPSEIFGHVKGSFTGAVGARDGLLKTCNKGILFLDELGDSTPHFQHSILRISENNTYRQVGSDEVNNHSALIIAATNKLGKIAKDLQHRFHILYVPQLQKEDIHVLTRSFYKDKNPKGDLKEEILNDLMTRKWPGNVRELKKYCERLYIQKGNKLFDKKLISAKPFYFDYHRYVDEFDVWSRRIQPLIDKYELDLRYQYQPIVLEIGQPMSFRSVDDEGSKYFGKYANELLLCLERKEADSLPGFIETVGKLIQDNLLPNFLNMLKVIEKEERLNFTGSNNRSNMPNTNYFTSMKINEAKMAFEKFYITYNIEEYKTKSRAAEAMGISQKNLDRIWRKHYK